jgi:L-amino acid N-acyltransferase YncA
MADNYKRFKFNNVWSDTYNAYIVNEGEDLKFYNTPSFSNEFAFPRFGETSYYLGNTKENRVIGFKLIAVAQTLPEYRSLLN